MPRLPLARGFSLLEVLVAFVVLALVAVAAFRLLSGALGNVGAAEEYTRAVLVAESALAEATAPIATAGTRSGEGEDGRVRWVVVITPEEETLSPGEPAALPMTPTRVYKVVATVTFPGAVGERSLALTTYRLGPREAL
jgi:general secretion pathway protein I